MVQLAPDPDIQRPRSSVVSSPGCTRSTTHHGVAHLSCRWNRGVLLDKSPAWELPSQ
jgi:hypothetical protein